MSQKPDVFLTPRLLVTPPPGDVEFASPGEPLVWPGEFVFGYPSGNRNSPGGPVPPAALSPTWLKNGSLLVFRRLRQDVGGFHTFLRTAAAALATTLDFREHRRASSGRNAGRPLAQWSTRVADAQR